MRKRTLLICAALAGGMLMLGGCKSVFRVSSGSVFHTGYHAPKHSVHHRTTIHHHRVVTPKHHYTPHRSPHHGRPYHRPSRGHHSGHGHYRY